MGPVDDRRVPTSWKAHLAGSSLQSAITVQSHKDGSKMLEVDVKVAKMACHDF